MRASAQPGRKLESAKAELAAAEANAQKTDADLTRYAQSGGQAGCVTAAVRRGRGGCQSQSRGRGLGGRCVRADQQMLEAGAGKTAARQRHRSQSSQTAPDQVSLAHAKFDAASADVERRRAELDQAELNLSYTIIRSPVNGIVGKKTSRSGRTSAWGRNWWTLFR